MADHLTMVMMLDQVCAINTAMSSLIKTLNVFPTERVVVERERSKRSYAIAPYFVSKLVAESPIGAMFPLLFGSIVYPAAGLHQRASRYVIKQQHAIFTPVSVHNLAYVASIVTIMIFFPS